MICSSVKYHIYKMAQALGIHANSYYNYVANYITMDKRKYV